MLLEEFTKRVLPAKDKMYRFANRMVRSEEEAKDIVQEVLIKIWLKREEMHLYKNMEAWCMRLVRNLSIDKLKSKHNQLGELKSEHAAIETKESFEQNVERSDTMKMVRQIIDQLPVQQKELIQLRDIEGYAYQEIADIMGIDMSKVKVGIFRARQKVKNGLLNLESYGTKQG